LDQKDFLRMAFFIKESNNIVVKIKENSQSKFFNRWLNFKPFLKSSNKELTIQIVDDGVYLDYNPEDISDFYNKLINKEIQLKKVILFSLIMET